MILSVQNLDILIYVQKQEINHNEDSFDTSDFDLFLDNIKQLT